MTLRRFFPIYCRVVVVLSAVGIGASAAFIALGGDHVWLGSLAAWATSLAINLYGALTTEQSE